MVSYKKIIIGGVITSIVALIAILITIPGVTITTSGDIICMGNSKEPCVSYFNITSSNYSLKFYNSTQKLSFSPNIKSYDIYRLTSTGRWYKTKFPINMTKGTLYQFKIIAYKNNPTDIIKWGIEAGDAIVDPIWDAYSANDFFTTLVSNEVYTTYGKAVFKIQNPTTFNISVTPALFNVVVNKYSGNSIKGVEYFILQNITHYDNITDSDWVCNGDMFAPWNSNYIIPNCSNVVIGWHINQYDKEEWKKLTNFVFKAKEKYTIQVITTWDPKLGFNSREWIPKLTVENINFSQDRWAWWNSSWSKCKNLTLSGALTLNRTVEPIKYNITGLTFTSINEIRIVNNSCSNGGTEISRDIFNNTTTSAEVVFLANYTTTDAEHVYSVYYNYPGATAPSYSSTILMTTNTTQINVTVTNQYKITYDDKDSRPDRADATQDCGLFNLWYNAGTTNWGHYHADDWVFSSAGLAGNCVLTVTFNGSVMTRFNVTNSTTGRDEIVECYDKNGYCLLNYVHNVTSAYFWATTYPDQGSTQFSWTVPNTWTGPATSGQEPVSMSFVTNETLWMIGVVNKTQLTVGHALRTDSWGWYTETRVNPGTVSVGSFEAFFLLNYLNQTDSNITIWKLHNPLTITLGSEESQPSAGGALNLYFNGTANANKTYTYGESINITGTSNVSETVYLYKNNVLMGSRTGNISIVSTYLNFSNATYTIKINSTSNTTGFTYYILINKGTPTLHLALNGTENNRTYSYPSAINATGWMETPSDGVGILYRNGTSCGSSLILNPSFEDWINTNTPSNWTLSNINNGYVYNTTSLVQSGIYSIVLRANSYGDGNSYGMVNSTEFIYEGNISLYIYPANSTYSYCEWGLYYNNQNYSTNTTCPATSSWNLINISNDSMIGKTVKIYLKGGTKLYSFGYGMYVDNIVMRVNSYEYIKLGIGVYNYSFNWSGNANYTSAGVWYYANVTQGNANLNIYLNGSQSNQSSYYPNSTVNFTATTNISDAYVQIWRNGTLLANTTGSATHVGKVGVGYWNYSAKVVNTTNFTAPVMSSLWWNVSKSSTVTTIYINGSSSNTIGYLYEIYNLTAASNATDGTALVKLSMNATGYGTNFTSGALSVSNISNITQAGVLRINATYDGDANYSGSTATSIYLTMKNASISLERPSGTSKWLLNTSSCTPFPGGCYQTGNFTPLNQTTTQWFYRINNTGAEIINITLEKNASLNGCIDYYITNNSANLFNPSATFTYNQSDTTAINVYTNLAVGGSASFWTWVVFTSCTPGTSINFNDVFSGTIT